MRSVILKISFTALVACTGAACSEETVKQTYDVPRGGKIEVMFKTDVPKKISFDFPDGNGAIGDRNRNCPRYKSTFGKMIQLCGALEQIVERGTGPYIKSLHGGGMTFKPENGEIRLWVKNLAHRDMKFHVTFAPAAK